MSRRPYPGNVKDSSGKPDAVQPVAIIGYYPDPDDPDSWLPNGGGNEGGATEAKQDAGNTSLTAIAAALAGALPLPTGAATAAKQDTGNTALGNLVTLITTQAGYLDGLETALAAILAKLIASPATEATLAAILAKMIASPATEATLAAQSAKLPATVGAKTAGASLSVTQGGYEYEAVAAGTAATPLGATGAAGDYLSHIIIQPATTAPGTVTVLDGATTIFTFTTGTLGDLRPIVVPFGMFSVTGAWKIATGANVAALGVGDFT